MDIRSQIAMVFHLDKCIGCHTCSIACKNIWTDRKGAEYMWWNNVETSLVLVILVNGKIRTYIKVVGIKKVIKSN